MGLKNKSLACRGRWVPLIMYHYQYPLEKEKEKEKNKKQKSPQLKFEQRPASCTGTSAVGISHFAILDFEGFGQANKFFCQDRS